MNLVLVGRVLKPQGIKGELKVSSASYNIFKRDLKVYIDSNEYLIESVKPLTDGIVLKLNLINSIDDAESFRNKNIFIEKANVTLKEGEYFASDVVGCMVVSDNKELGILYEIENYGASDIYYVKGEKKFSFPALSTVILKYDIDNKLLIVDENRLKEVALYED